MFRKWLTLAVSLSVLAGCGVPATGNAPDSPMAIQHMSHHKRMHKKWAEKLGLTAEQKEAIKGIFKEGKEVRRAARKAKWQEMKDILLAETVDADKLRQFLEDKQAAKAGKLDTMIPKIVAVRDVLTDDQRKQAVELIQKKGDKAHKHHHHGNFLDKMTKDLDLTDDQQEALDTLKAAFTDKKEQKKEARKQKWAAIAAFLTSGDQDALRTSLQAIDRPEMPIDAMVGFASSLSLDQRTAIIDKLEKKMAKRCPHKDKAAAMDDDDDDDQMTQAEDEGKGIKVEVEVTTDN